jgi:hypothetical protein
MVNVTQMSTEISVKWNAQKETVQVDLDSSVNDLKALLFSIFNITPDRQKLLLKGSMLKVIFLPLIIG